MFNIELISSLEIKLHNVALYVAQNSVVYDNVISPFSRLYLIKKGYGEVIIGNERIPLEPNTLYLIPSFTLCTYRFSADMVQYYVHLSTSLHGGLNIYDVFATHKAVRLKSGEEELLNSLLGLHPGGELTTPDPKVYQSKAWLNKKIQYENVAQFLETQGILKQLLSRFLFLSESTTVLTRQCQRPIKQTLIYITKHLSEDISLSILAERACMSNDHFGKVFKSVMGLSPIDYIVRRRIEKSQHLLLTTSDTITQIIAKVGFKSVSHFSRVFKRITGSSPGAYRINQ